MRRVAVLTAMSAVLLGAAGTAAEVDYIEDYVLAEDRAAALELLIPGSEDYYYYHCLYFQSHEQFDKVEELLRAWIKRYKRTARVREVQQRQLLLTYARNPEQTLKQLGERLKLRFNHQRRRVGETPNLPTALDQALLKRARLRARALKRDGNYKNLDGFEDRALGWLARTELNPDQRRNLLERLRRPDLPGLPKLIVADLQHRYSKPFGSMAIHRQLLLEQLDELVRLQPDLLNQGNYVNIYLTKLQPHDDSDWLNDPAEREAYLDRLWSFVAKLAPVHNSLKAHVLYHRLVHDRSMGAYSKPRFLTYLRLPRNVHYVDRKFLAAARSRQQAADLAADFGKLTGLPPIRDDESLVRSYFQHFLVDESTTKPYEPYVNDTYLRHLFAETKIVNGLGEPEQWYSLLPPAQYQALKERVDLDFAATNQTQFAAEEPVSLELDVKNVQTLIVKVFEINARNYYEQFGREVNTDINLDGLVANQELTYRYSDPPLRRVRRRFEFPRLSSAGVYVIDFIGSGLSSRVVVRKGMLRHLVKHTTAGHLFTVLDDKQRKVDDANIWLAGHQYEPDENGQILVPYTERGGHQPIVITHGDFSSLGFFRHDQERYELQAGFYVDRESLLERNSAQLLVRPALLLNGTPMTLSVLQNVQLRITATDHNGITSSKEVKDFELFEDRESVHEIQVPSRLSSLHFSLAAEVPSLTGQGQIEVSAHDQLEINQIAKTEHIDDLHLVFVDGEYQIELLGRSGESIIDHAVSVSLKHRDFRDRVEVDLQTDRDGKIRLGPLDEVEEVVATGSGERRHRWQLSRDSYRYHRSVHAVVGEPLELPFMPQVDQPLRDHLSLLELRGSSFVADRFAALSAKEGMLRITDLAAGDYDLLLKDSGQHLRLRLVDGPSREGYGLGKSRQLELRSQQPLQIARLAMLEDKLRIELKNATRFSRVHLFATRYEPAYSSYGKLSTIVDPEPLLQTPRRALSVYAAGRNIGDEYQYIIDRKYAQKFPGVMLDRPSVLLNPWAIRDTETGQQHAQDGSDFAAEPEAAPPNASRLSREAVSAESSDGLSDLDFLSGAASVLVNLLPNSDGMIEVPRDALGSHTQVHVVAVDPRTTAYRKLSLPSQPRAVRDLRLATSLDAQKHFTQQKRITVIRQGETFTLDDISTSRFELYDSLARVHALYSTLTRHPHLAEFSFLMGWPDFVAAEKQRLYSKHACHELNFFLSRKDPEFFAATVQPYLENKKDKTFLDHYLLGHDLTPYLDSWAYSQLNTVERILLSQRIETDREYTRRDVLDRFALLPDNIDRFNQLFQTAIASSSLDIDDVALQISGKDVAGGGSKMLGGMGGFGGGRMGGVGGGRELAGVPAQRLGEQELADKLSLSKKQARSWGRQSEARFYFDTDAALREDVRQLYRRLDKTQEWVEHNYYRLPIAEQNSDLIAVNAFWRDYVRHDAGAPFHSQYLAAAAGSFAEMMFALAVLDLPFESAEHQREYDETKLTLVAASPAIVFHEEIREAASRADQTPILVSENFFQRDDRYRFVANERTDKFVTDEFLVRTVYGCQVVATNPTSSVQKLDLLLQVPQGAVPVLNGQATKSVHTQLEPYATETIEYFFYFPAAGRFPHYPVQVAKNEELLAAGEPVQLSVVETLSRVDRGSWEYISQNGSDQDVIEFLRTHNLHHLDLGKIAFRMADEPFFLNVVELLRKRHSYDHTLWSYGIKHNDPTSIREYLQHEDSFVAQCGLALNSELLQINPVVRKTYQHMDYRPLVNARAHPLGRKRQILNDRLSVQYHQLLKVLSYDRALNSDDRLALTYYLLLQDRIAAAMALFAEIDPAELETRMQYDYFAAYLAMCRQDVDAAGRIARDYSSHPVVRWKNAFLSIDKQLDEIAGGDVEVVDSEQRNQTQTQLAATEPSLDFSVESKEVTINYQNLNRVEVNYYLMDIELLYSRNPFVQQYSHQFSSIRPNQTEVVMLPEEAATFTFPLPAELHNRNVLVEVKGGGTTEAKAYYSNSLALQIVENYGQLRVANSLTGKPLPAVYVKVYARMKDGKVRFYKDGYSDLRGRFDYSSLSTNELDFVEKFSLLVLSEEHGAVVREVDTP